MPTPIDTTMMTDITNTDETSSMPSTSTSPPSSSPPSILSTIKFQQMIKQQQQFENDPGINIGHITVSHNGYVIMLSGFKGYKVSINHTACVFVLKIFQSSNPIKKTYDQHTYLRLSSSSNKQKH